MKIGTRLVAFIGVLASFALVVRQEHRPGAFQAVIVAAGIAPAALSALVGIMRSHGSGRIDVPGAQTDGWVLRYANSERALIVTLVIGIAVAILGIWNPASF